MASEFKVHWVYPPNWTGFLTDKEGWKRVVLNLTGKVDTDTEDKALKLDIDSLKCSNGKVPKRTVIEWIEWSVQGTGEVVLMWDRADYPIIKVLSRRGKTDWRYVGGKCDPGSEGDKTGDILLSCDASYDITLSVRLKDD